MDALFDRLLRKVKRLLTYDSDVVSYESVESRRHFCESASQFDFDDINNFQDPDVDALFDRLREVKRLLEYRCRSAIDTGRISLYYEKLKSLSEAFQSFKIPRLSVLVDTIRSRRHEYTRLKFHSDNVFDLAAVGDRLASLAYEVAAIYEASVRDFGEAVEECDSQFNFDINNFQDPEARGILARNLDPDVDLRPVLNGEQEGEVFVGFQAEVSNLRQQLACITKKQLQVISIVGMAGLGKTTLARRLYHDPYVVSYFYARAWVTCSQVYHKRDILLVILKSVIEITEEVSRMNENMLAHELYRALKGRRYLIVIDDIWSIDVWDDFKRCFPDDNNGSKIMLTTRLKDVALHAQSDGNPLCLRFLTEEESFDLFRRKTFIPDNIFDCLSLIGKYITTKCRGLPLAIVVIAGLLKNNKKIGWWSRVAQSVSSYILVDEYLALSYDHLPQHLRPCFLSLGAFPKNHDIPARKLICLWIAEDFIHFDGTEKSLEDVADNYLNDLIGRSLVVVGKRSSNGAIKTCRIHDLLHDLCLTKAVEENFSQNIFRFNKHSYPCSHSLESPSKKSQLLLNTNVLAISSKCSCYSSEVSQSFFKDVSLICDISKMMRALDMSSIELSVFPDELLQLVHLRYLELRFSSGNPPESISLLQKLQILIMSSRMNMVLPKNMWKMINLRHLCIKSGENLVKFSDVEEEPHLLENMQTMSLVSPTRPCQNVLSRAHNLRKLGLCGPLTTKSGDLKCPDISQLIHLETLKLLNTNFLCKAGRLSTSTIFPESLKNLTVSNTYLDWREAWIFQLIPNLEVLKLKLHAFAGKDWETTPEAFPRLKFLRLDELDIVIWRASSNHFPVLQRLQVYQCPYLMEIPEEFGNICTLEWIELRECNEAAANSAREIKKELVSNGHDWPKILVSPGLSKPTRKRADSYWKDLSNIALMDAALSTTS